MNSASDERFVFSRQRVTHTTLEFRISTCISKKLVNDNYNHGHIVLGNVQKHEIITVIPTE